MSHYGGRGSGGQGGYGSGASGAHGRGGIQRHAGGIGGAGGMGGYPQQPTAGYNVGYGDFDPSYGAAAAAAAAYGGGYGMHPGFPGFPPQELPSPLDAEIQCVLREIHTELTSLEGSEMGEQFRNARRLLTSEKERLENCIDPEWLEVDIPKPVKVIKKVLVPTYRHSNFNFVGKVLGPKGATLQTLCKTHKCHIYILGRGSTKDREKEAELLASGDPQHAHFAGPLHVKIETFAPAYVAYTRVSAVIEELSRILQPIHEDTTPSHLKNSNGNKDEEDKTEGCDESQNGGGNGGRGGKIGGARGGRGGFPSRPGPGGPSPRGRGKGGQPVGFRPY